MLEDAKGSGTMQGVDDFHRILFEWDGGLILADTSPSNHRRAASRRAVRPGCRYCQRTQ